VTVVRKNSPIESLGLGPGVHLLKVVITGDTVAYEVAATTPSSTPQLRTGTGFVGKWSGTARKMEVSSDDWLAHINAKHLR